MLISPVHESDLPKVEDLVAHALEHSVVDSKDDLEFILGDIRSGLAAWAAAPGQSQHLKCELQNTIAGVILVKNYWNLSTLFVSPPFQRKGVARSLLHAVIPECRRHSPRSALLVNSSTVAVPFYAAFGFTQIAPAKDRPGGCVPMIFRFD